MAGFKFGLFLLSKMGLNITFRVISLCLQQYNKWVRREDEYEALSPLFLILQVNNYKVPFIVSLHLQWSLCKSKATSPITHF